MTTDPNHIPPDTAEETTPFDTLLEAEEIEGENEEDETAPDETALPEEAIAPENTAVLEAPEEFEMSPPDELDLPVESTLAENNLSETLTESIPAESTLTESIPSETLALPEATPHEPPRPLVPGAFLRGEFEVKELLARGPVNFYLADNGDYEAPLPLLVAERHFGDDPIEQPAVQIESSQPGAQPLASPLFVPCETFVQDDREYSVFNYEATSPLSEQREAANDARYLAMLSTLAEGLLELEQHGLVADFSPDTLRFDERGNLRYYGFIEPNQPNAQASEVAGLTQLRETNGFLLRRVFATTSTMRLDDEFGALAFCEETKQFIGALSREEYSTLKEAVEDLRSLVSDGAPRVETALLSDVGQERELNEDSGAIFTLHRAGHTTQYEIEVYAVADGMGGHEGGEVASERTIEALQQAVQSRAGLNWNDNTVVRHAMLEIIDEVNAAVLDLTNEPKYRGLRAKPGATLVFAIRLGQRVFIGNVGDSRAYKWNATNGLQRISKDHSYVQNLIDQGVLAEEDAFGHPEGSIITAHIGLEKLRLKDVFLRLFAPGDKLLLVSDGVVDMLREEEIAPHLQQERAATICRSLVDASNVAGGADNITVACVIFS